MFGVVRYFNGDGNVDINFICICADLKTAKIHAKNYCYEMYIGEIIKEYKVQHNKIYIQDIIKAYTVENGDSSYIFAVIKVPEISGIEPINEFDGYEDLEDNEDDEDNQDNDYFEELPNWLNKLQLN
jgi:hypothetical protein